MRTPLSRIATALLVLATISATGCCFPFPVANLEPGWGQLHDFFEYSAYRGPTWTTDGQGIVFEATHERKETPIEVFGRNIFLVNVSGDTLSLWEPDDDLGDGLGDSDATHDLSPDSSRIAFSTLRHGWNVDSSGEIATARLDGSDYKRLTESKGMDISPTWSPDGSLIAFTSDREAYLSTEDDITSGYFGVYIMEADGNNVRRVAPSVYVLPRRVEWSPDGQWLAFTAHAWHEGGGLYTVSVDGTQLNNLGEAFPDAWNTAFGINHYFHPTPAWSPDGRWLAYIIATDFESRAIVISDPKGTETREIVRTPSKTQIGSLSWSSDTSLRFTSSRDLIQPDKEYRDNAIYEIEIGGSNIQRMADVEWGTTIAWSPDSRRIAFWSKGSMYTMSADGSDRRVLVTNGPSGPETTDVK